MVRVGCVLFVFRSMCHAEDSSPTEPMAEESDAREDGLLNESCDAAH